MKPNNKINKEATLENIIREMLNDIDDIDILTDMILSFVETGVNIKIRND